MLILWDTSVLVASFIQSHPKHVEALSWLKQVKSGKITMAVAAHSLAECYAVLTKLPLTPKISPSIACYLIKQDIEMSAEIISLSPTDYLITIKELEQLGLTGGIIYDALILRAAKKAKAQKLLTLNIRDFKKLHPADSSFIISP